MRLARLRLSDAGGATAVEFAMVLPLLVVMLMGVFEFGWTQHCLSSTRYALETASRDLMIDPDMTEAQLEAKVQAILTDRADPNVDVTLVINDTAAGRIATITGAYVREIAIPMLPVWPITYNVSVETSLSVLPG